MSQTDMIRRRHLRTKNLKMLILDEADEMLSRGFKEQIYDVYRYLPPHTQVVLVSATLPREGPLTWHLHTKRVKLTFGLL